MSVNTEKKTLPLPIGGANREFINCTNKNLLMHNQLGLEG